MKILSNSSKFMSLILGGILMSTSLAMIAQAKDVKSGIGQPKIRTQLNGGPITGTSQVGETGLFTTSASSFGDLPGATTTIVIPSGTTGMIRARFSGVSACITAAGQSFNNWCTARILINRAEGNPKLGTFFVFDSPNPGSETVVTRRSLAMERFSNVLSPGTYTVKVQLAVFANNFQTALELLGWTLAVDRIQVTP
ncbi:MAG: hypothetical protein WCD18_26440 [Thermosynechococcaceae cyanobacterium]